MQNKLLLLVVMVLFGVSCLISSKPYTTFFNKEIIKVKDTKNNETSKLELENYIIGVVAAEMPASFSDEALKAQAIAARTYAKYKMNQKHSNNYDIVTDVSNQSYITEKEMKEKWGSDYNKYYEKIKSAVKETEGKIMTYNNEVIESFYFAMSNGYTENSELVFNEDKNYLKSVKSIYENEELKNFNVTKTFNKTEIINKLGLNSNELIIKDIVRSNTGRVLSLNINNITFKGTDIRKKLKLRSTDFVININNDEVSITTKGYGHGVGMSQYGANGMASHGYNYEEILKYFYKNIEITRL